MTDEITAPESYSFAEARDSFLSPFKRAGRSLSKLSDYVPGGRSVAALAGALATPILVSLASFSPAAAETPTVIPIVAPTAVPSDPSLPYKIVKLDHRECVGLAAFVTDHFNAESTGKMSQAFSESVGVYVMPDGKNMTCTGTPKGSNTPTIFVKTTLDFAVWGAIEDAGRRTKIDIAHSVIVAPGPKADPQIPAAIADRTRVLRTLQVSQLEPPK